MDFATSAEEAVSPSLFSSHAEMRMRQRGLDREAAELVATLFDRRAHVGRGLESRWVSRARARRLRRAGLPAALVERMRRILLVVEPRSGIVVTVLHAAAVRARRYRRGIRGAWMETVANDDRIRERAA